MSTPTTPSANGHSAGDGEANPELDAIKAEIEATRGSWGAPSTSSAPASTSRRGPGSARCAPRTPPSRPTARAPLTIGGPRLVGLVVGVVILRRKRAQSRERGGIVEQKKNKGEAPKHKGASSRTGPSA